MADVVAVDLGGTNIRAARMDDKGAILARDKIATEAEKGMAAVVERVADLVQKVRGPQTVAVGVGTPGVPDQKTGCMTLKAVNIPQSQDFPLTATLTSRIKLPVAADNDGNLAALGESWLGAGRGEHIVLIFTLGTGIGGGVVIDGKVYHGCANLVAEFGHHSIYFDGRPCSCGNSGCLEAYASASALGRDAREALRKGCGGAKNSLLWKRCGGEAGIDKADARMVCDAARDGDPFASALLDQCCKWLACGIGSIINDFNPSCVLLAGGLALAGETLTSRLVRELDGGRAFAPIWRCCKIKLATLGDDAGLMGAARIAWQKVENKGLF
jgi:glucokinase